VIKLPTSYTKIGNIVKTYGNEGEVLVKIFKDINLEKCESVFVSINNKPIPFFIDSITQRSDMQFVISFDGINTNEKALEICPCEILLDDEVFNNHSINNDFTYVVGYSVYNKDVFIGNVTDVVDTGMQEILKVDHNGTEILIPWVDEIVTSIDENKKTIKTKLPEGLIDLYV
jgi:16S rRNA processing protein RimM